MKKEYISPKAIPFVTELHGIIANSSGPGFVTEKGGDDYIVNEEEVLSREHGKGMSNIWDNEW